MGRSGEGRAGGEGGRRGVEQRCGAGRHLGFVHQDLGEISQPHRLHRLRPTLLPLRAFACALALTTATLPTSVAASTLTTTNITSTFTAPALTIAVAGTTFAAAALTASVRHARWLG